MRLRDRIRHRAVVASLLLAGHAAVVAEGRSSPVKVDRQEVAFTSGGIRLAGTLHLPRSTARVPAAVLVHGSGRVDRSSMEHFAKLLAENGIAALAYDKRGVGKSQGPELAWREYSFEDLAADAAAGIGYLATRAEIDTGRVGILAASQGGWVAPISARRAPNVSFIVMVSASVTTVAEDNLFERDARLRREGFGEDEIAEVHAMHLVDLAVSRSGERFDEFSRLWDQNKSKRWLPRVYLGAAPSGPQSSYRSWYRTVMDVDPVPILRDLPMPILWLFGDPALDGLCPVEASMKALDSLRAAGKPYEVHSFPGADHSLQVRGKDAAYRPVLAAWLSRHVLTPAGRPRD